MSENRTSDSDQDPVIEPVLETQTRSGDAAFEASLFIEKNRKKIWYILGSIVVIAVLVLGVQFNKALKQEKAKEAFRTASTLEDYQRIIRDYGDTDAAGNCHLLAAELLRQNGKFDESLAMLRNFMRDYPDHQLAPMALIGISTTLEMSGKSDEAASTLDQVGAKYGTTFAFPIALYTKAMALRAKGQLEDARHAFEDVIAKVAPNSLIQELAKQEISMLRTAEEARALKSPAAAAPAPPAPATAQASSTTGIMSLLPKPAVEGTSK